MFKPIEQFKLYITSSNGIKIPSKNTTIVLHSEDTDNAIQYIPKLNIPNFMVRYLAFIPIFRVINKPVVIKAQDLKKQEFKLDKVILKLDQVSKKPVSFMIDFSPYTMLINKRFNGLVRISRLLYLVNNFYSKLPKNKDKYLFIIHEKNKVSNNNLILSLLYAVKKKLEFPFEKVFLVIIERDSVKYMLIHDKLQSKKIQYGRLKTIIDAYFKIDMDEIEEFSNEKETNQKTLVKHINIDKIIEKMITSKVYSTPEEINTAKTVLKMAFSNDPDLPNKIDLDDPEQVKSYINIAKKSMVSGKSADDADVIVDKRSKKEFQDMELKVTEYLFKQLDDPTKVPDVIVNDGIHSPEIIKKVAFDTKDPKQEVVSLAPIFKRETERELVKKWLKVVAESFSSYDEPLEVKSVDIEPVEDEPGEITKSKFEYWSITFKPVKGKEFTVRFKVPMLIDGKYALLGGTKSIFQYVYARIPIFIPVPGTVMIFTTYASTTITYSTDQTYTIIRIAGEKIPLIYALLTVISLTDLLKKIGITIASKDERKILLGILPISNINSLTKEQMILLNGLSKLKVVDYSGLDLDELIRRIIEDNIGVRGYTNIQTVMQNILDNLSKEVLESKGLPTNIIDLMLYAHSLIVNGESIDKLDVNNGRIRQQDVIIEAIYKTLQRSYTMYRHQVLAGVQNPRMIVKENAIINYLRENQAMDMFEQGNPLEEVESLFKTRLVGPGGLPSEQSLTFKDRNLHDSYFGIFDPIDTSEGNPGIYQHLTVGAYFNLITGTIQQKEFTDKNHRIFSHAASLIPFVEKDDGNRALMACNQMKQAVPIMNAESPIVQTGYESVIPSMLTNSFIDRAKKDGKVLEISNNLMIIEYIDGTKEVIDLSPQPLSGMTSLKNASIKTPILKKGEKFKAGAFLTKSNFMGSDFKLAQGRNMIVAFMPYEGMNFEDGVVIREGILDKMTSVHFDTISVKLTHASQLSFYLPIKSKFKKDDIILSIVNENAKTQRDILADADGEIIDYEVYANIPFEAKKTLMDLIKSRDAIIYQQNQILKKYGLKEKDYLYTILKRNFGRFKEKGELIDGIKVVVKVVYYLKMTMGDKLHNRHGNKGVVCGIIPDKEAPLLPNGEKVDLILSPLGVVGRINMGQVYELYTGRVMHELKNHVLNENNFKKGIKLIIDVYKALDSSPDKSYSNYIDQFFSKFSKKDYENLKKKLRSGLKFDIIVRQFGNFTFKNLEQAYKILNINFKERLYIPKYDVYTKEPVSVGLQFIEKLEHMSHVKESVRAFGPRDPITEQAVRGRRRSGGQRVGEMDTWAYLAYNTPNLIKDLMIVNGDDLELKYQIIHEIRTSGHSSLSEGNKRIGSKRVMLSYLTGMEILSIDEVISEESNV